MCPFVDIAIGAPFAGKDQRGKVLIYNGNKDGLHTKASQILQGLWASQTIPSGFGFTLRGDSDIDKNDYPGKGFFLFPWEPTSQKEARSRDSASCESGSPPEGEGQAYPQMAPGFCPWFPSDKTGKADKTNTPLPAKKPCEKGKVAFENPHWTQNLSTLRQKFLFETPR